MPSSQAPENPGPKPIGEAAAESENRSSTITAGPMASIGESLGIRSSRSKAIH